MNIEPKNISFTITSSPNGAAIFVDGINSGFTTPYTMKYLESELLTPKTIFVRNGTALSSETYIISSEMVTRTSDGNGPVGTGTYGDGYNPIPPVKPSNTATP